MTPAELAAKIADARARRVTLIVAELDKSGEQPEALLSRIDHDACWFKVWTAALGIGAGCPSHKTREQVRERIRARIPYRLTDDDRALLEECEADAAWDRHVDGQIAEGRGM